MKALEVARRLEAAGFTEYYICYKYGHAVVYFEVEGAESNGTNTSQENSAVFKARV